MYMANVFEPPQDIKTRIQKDIFKFIWKKRTELIARATMYLHETKDGLRIPNVTESIRGVKTKWIRNITEKEDKTPWLWWPRYYIGTPLSTIKQEWNFLKDNSSPRADPSRPNPKSKKCPFCQRKRRYDSCTVNMQRLQQLWKEVQQLLNKICNGTYPLNLANIILQNKNLNNKTEEKLCRYIQQ